MTFEMTLLNIFNQQGRIEEKKKTLIYDSLISPKGEYPYMRRYILSLYILFNPQ